MKRMTDASFLLFFVMLICGVSCEYPVEFERSNTLDPGSSSYVPIPPTGLSLRTERNVAIVSWVDQSEFEDGYVVEKAIQDSVTFQLFKYLPANSVSLRDSTGDFGTNTWYRVASYKNKDVGRRYSPFQTLRLDAGSITAAAITTDAQNFIIVSWQENSHFEELFRVDVAILSDPGAPSDTTYLPLAILPSDTDIFTDTTTVLSFGSVRVYRISMLRGQSILSTITTSMEVDQFMSPTVGDPGHPQSVLLNEETFEFRWRDRSNFEDGFEIERGVNDGQGNMSFTAVTTLPPNTIVLEDTTIFMNGTIYTYRVRGQKSSKRSLWANATFLFDIPAPILFPFATGPSNEIHIPWMQTTLAVRYILELSENFGPFQTAAILPATANSYKLLADTTKVYQWRVRSAASPVSSVNGAKFVNGKWDYM